MKKMFKVSNMNKQMGNYRNKSMGVLNMHVHFVFVRRNMMFQISKLKDTIWIYVKYVKFSKKQEQTIEIKI